MSLEELNIILKDKEKRLEIYKLAYAFHLQDLEYSIPRCVNVFGMCTNIRKSIYFQHKVWISIRAAYLPEFKKLKPIKFTYDILWWPTTDYSIRKEMYEKYLINLK